MLGMLAIEFILGMALNLFLALPSEGGIVAILESSPVLVLHLLLGVGLVGIAARATALSFRSPLRAQRAAGPFALLSGLVAFLAGISFAFGGQAPSASFVMSLGFVGMAVAAAVLLASRSSGARLANFPIEPDLRHGAGREEDA